MVSTKYRISQAHRITGKSRTTLAAHIDAGKLSSETDRHGNRVIDASELIRVYGDDCDFELAESSRKKSTAKKINRATMSGQNSHEESTAVQQLLEREIKEREREREQYQQQIEHLQDALKLAQEGHNKATLLLEHRSGEVGEWENSLRSLESRLANHETTSQTDRDEIQQNAKRQIAHYKRAYDEEKSKSFWKKLFG